ncbi:MAG TPA: aminopeptidase [Solirubrobacteraceae bacterium]|nr:aminopeptidase [Solirubrobacteraceae bacterium]
MNPDAFAGLLCDYCLEVRRAQQVLVQSTTLAEPLLLALQRALLEREAWPLIRPTLPDQDAQFWAAARDSHLDAFPPAALVEAESVDAFLRIDAPANTRALAAVDPARLARAMRAQEPVREARLARRWCGTLWPTDAAAQQAGMSTSDYADYVARTLFLDQPDPVASWTALGASQERLISRLSPCSELRIEGEGTDLTVDVSARTWVNSDGRRNMPSGEVFTGPVETSASGRIHYSIPTSPRGLEVSGITLEFREGAVVAARAERGDDVLQAMLASDDGARRLGEIGIGTNFGVDRAIGSTLVDEKMGGTVHLALGRSYPETGGTNESAIHWDMICDLRQGGRLTADGEPILVDGRFVQSD